MRAHIEHPQTGTRQEWRRKPVHEVTLVIDGDTDITVKAVFYDTFSPEGTTLYCNLWVWGTDVYTSGHGKAGGYGYHKQSAALMEAIRSAGITLTGDEYGGDGPGDGSGSIAGRGTGPMEAALIAIARAATGRRKFKVLWANP